MLRKFLEGLIFGGGFGVSFITIWYLAALLFSPLVVSNMERGANKQLSQLEAGSSPPVIETTRESGKSFHELGVDEQIKRASAVALATYEQAPDGKMKAIIREFLKKDPNITIYYNVGDEFSPSSYYPKEHVSYGDGVVIFFTGSPATMRLSMTYSGDRIGSLSDLPLKLFREKCRDPHA